MMKTKNIYAVMVIIPFILLSLSGCASIGYRTNPRSSHISPGAYPGVRSDMTFIKNSAGAANEGWAPQWIIFVGNLIFILDTPLSFALDTICLPYDIFQTGDRTKKQGKNNNIRNKYGHPIVKEENHQE